MDDEWIYGSSPQNVFWAIIEGRPQGMPAFGGKIAEDQVWRLVAYVRSLSGLPDKEKERKQP
jgi:cytochrome c oxidase cbb3-type subunit 3